MSETIRMKNDFELYLDAIIQRLEKNNQYCDALEFLKRVTEDMYLDIVRKTLADFLVEHYDHDGDLDIALQFVLYELALTYKEQATRYLFDVKIVGHEQQTLRQIIAPATASLGALADAILVSFGLDCGPFAIEHKNNVYMDESEEEYGYESAFDQLLLRMDFTRRKEMILDTFTIKFHICLKDTICETISSAKEFEILDGKGGNVYISEELNLLFRKDLKKFEKEIIKLIAKDYQPISKKEFNDQCNEFAEYRFFLTFMIGEDEDV